MAQATEQLTHAPPTPQAYVRAGEVELAYRDSGHGEPVVFLHGFTGPDSWDAVVAQLQDRYRCVVVETLGFGDARGPLEADYTIPGHASRVQAVLDALHLDGVHLVGHDTGGAIAQSFAARWPERLRSLVLADCDAFDNWPPLQIRLLKQALRVPGAGAVLRASMRLPVVARSRLGFGRLVHDKRLLTRERVARYARPLLSSDDGFERYKRMLLAMDNRYTLEVVDALRRFERPTLIVWGAKDSYWSTAWGEKLRDTIPGAVGLEVIPDAGLACHEERPAEFSAILRTFLGQVPTVSAGTASRVGRTVAVRDTHR